MNCCKPPALQWYSNGTVSKDTNNSTQITINRVLLCAPSPSYKTIHPSQSPTLAHHPATRRSTPLSHLLWHKLLLALPQFRAGVWSARSIVESMACIKHDTLRLIFLPMSHNNADQLLYRWRDKRRKPWTTGTLLIRIIRYQWLLINTSWSWRRRLCWNSICAESQHTRTVACAHTYCGYVCSTCPALTRWP
jgi:hypothetical protein